MYEALQMCGRGVCVRVCACVCVCVVDVYVWAKGSEVCVGHGEA